MRKAMRCWRASEEATAVLCMATDGAGLPTQRLAQSSLSGRERQKLSTLGNGKAENEEEFQDAPEDALLRCAASAHWTPPRPWGIHLCPPPRGISCWRRPPIARPPCPVWAATGGGSKGGPLAPREPPLQHPLPSSPARELPREPHSRPGRRHDPRQPGSLRTPCTPRPVPGSRRQGGRRAATPPLPAAVGSRRAAAARAPPAGAGGRAGRPESGTGAPPGAPASPPGPASPPRQAPPPAAARPAAALAGPTHRAGGAAPLLFPGRRMPGRPPTSQGRRRRQAQAQQDRGWLAGWLAAAGAGRALLLAATRSAGGGSCLGPASDAPPRPPAGRGASRPISPRHPPDSSHFFTRRAGGEPGQPRTRREPPPHSPAHARAAAARTARRSRPRPAQGAQGEQGAHWSRGRPAVAVEAPLPVRCWGGWAPAGASLPPNRGSLPAPPAGRDRLRCCLPRGQACRHRSAGPASSSRALPRPPSARASARLAAAAGCSGHPPLPPAGLTPQGLASRHSRRAREGAQQASPGGTREAQLPPCVEGPSCPPFATFRLLGGLLGRSARSQKSHPRAWRGPGARPQGSGQIQPQGGAFLPHSLGKRRRQGISPASPAPALLLAPASPTDPSGKIPPEQTELRWGVQGGALGLAERTRPGRQGQQSRRSPGARRQRDCSVCLAQQRVQQKLGPPWTEHGGKGEPAASWRRTSRDSLSAFPATSPADAHPTGSSSGQRQGHSWDGLCQLSFGEGGRPCTTSLQAWGAQLPLSPGWAAECRPPPWGSGAGSSAYLPPGCRDGRLERGLGPLPLAGGRLRLGSLLAPLLGKAEGGRLVGLERRAATLSLRPPGQRSKPSLPEASLPSRAPRRDGLPRAVGAAAGSLGGSGPLLPPRSRLGWMLPKGHSRQGTGGGGGFPAQPAARLTSDRRRGSAPPSCCPGKERSAQLGGGRSDPPGVRALQERLPRSPQRHLPAGRRLEPSASPAQPGRSVAEHPPPPDATSPRTSRSERRPVEDRAAPRPRGPQPAERRGLYLRKPLLSRRPGSPTPSLRTDRLGRADALPASRPAGGRALGPSSLPARAGPRAEPRGEARGAPSCRLPGRGCARVRDLPGRPHRGQSRKAAQMPREPSTSAATQASRSQAGSLGVQGPRKAMLRACPATPRHAGRERGGGRDGGRAGGGGPPR
ncbi:collagen alpha-2(I) chain-like [Tiliqua scincoides]|uniref:collagen alpha-2(I) chain-like n=1 Tax=Tiliqua scincoides TaxID=71010 RepID=UPI003461C174